MKLTNYVAPGKAGRAAARALTIEPGAINGNGQMVMRKAGRAADDLPGQNIYVLRCTRCKHEYGTPGIRVNQRKCPKCDGGTAGLPIPEPEPTLFG